MWVQVGRSVTLDSARAAEDAEIEVVIHGGGCAAGAWTAAPAHTRDHADDSAITALVVLEHDGQRLIVSAGRDGMIFARALRCDG